MAKGNYWCCHAGFGEHDPGCKNFVPAPPSSATGACPTCRSDSPEFRRYNVRNRSLCFDKYHDIAEAGEVAKEFCEDMITNLRENVAEDKARRAESAKFNDEHKAILNRLAEGLERQEFEAWRPIAPWSIKQLGEEVARAIHYGDRRTKDEWEGFKRGWQAARASRKL